MLLFHSFRGLEQGTGESNVLGLGLLVLGEKDGHDFFRSRAHFLIFILQHETLEVTNRCDLTPRTHTPARLHPSRAGQSKARPESNHESRRSDGPTQDFTEGHRGITSNRHQYTSSLVDRCWRPTYDMAR
jgi:hypothetical protein